MRTIRPQTTILISMPVVQTKEGRRQMKYAREIAIAVLLAALCLATWQCDRYKGKLNAADAEKKRQETISSIEAGQADVRKRENEAVKLDRKIADIDRRRAEIKRAEKATAVSRKEIEDEVDKDKGNIHALARLYKFAGYSCAVR